ncbi:MAG: hypothetical protein ACYC99_05880 [Candidatus Geothermincolia bacterium]
MNPYRYAINNPINYFDATGLSSSDVHSGVGQWTYGTYFWARLSGLSPLQAEQLARADDGTDGGYTSWMPMLGDQSRHFNQSRSGDSRLDWAELELKRAVALKKAGKCDAAIGHLGKGLHSVQDYDPHRDWDTGSLGWYRHPDWYDVWDDPRNEEVRKSIEERSLEYLRRYLRAVGQQ